MPIIDPLPLPPPRREDILFRVDNQNHRSVNVSLNLRASSDVAYLEGYRLGALRLAQVACEKIVEKNFLVYPILYLYRHHVELALKRLLALVADLTAEGLDHKSQEDMKGHNIEQLWADFKRFLKTDRIRKWCRITLSPEDIAGVDAYIQQLSAIDLDSQASRYPRNKKGEPSLPEIYINLAVFAEHMERLCGHLDGIDSYLSSVRETVNDMEGEHFDGY